MKPVKLAGLGVTAALALGAVAGCGTAATNNSGNTGSSANTASTGSSNQTAVNATGANQTSNTAGSGQNSTAPAQFLEYSTSQSFSAAVSSLKHSISTNGMMVLGTLNQAGALKTTGLNLKGAESFFVGNPVVAKGMFQMNAAVGAELPMRVYVWVDNQGKTNMGYVQPSTLLGAINPQLGSKGAMMDKKLAMIVKGAQATTVSSASGQAQTSVQFMQSTSAKSFSQTVSALKHSVSTNGMMVLGTLNQAGALKTTGLNLKGAESFFVGNPVVAKKMFQMNPAVGTELPMRVYVWVDSQGKTHVGYYQPSAVLDSISPALGSKGAMMNKKLSMIASQATS